MSETRTRSGERPPRSNAVILVVDDEPLICETLTEYLSSVGFEVLTSASGEEALRVVEQQHVDVALCDVQLPGIDGLEVLERLHRLNPELFVLLITAYATVENVVEAFQRGAHDYLMKPILLDEVVTKVRRLLTHRELHQENQWLRRELNRQHAEKRIVGSGPAMQEVFELIRKVAPTRSTVLIGGESGTGKELVAYAIHEASLQASSSSTQNADRGPRGTKGNPARFVAVNCAAIPHDLLENQLFGHRKGAFTGADRDQAGMFVHAGTGTLFLDEVGEMTLATQAKLLRAIEQKEVLPVGADEPVRVDARVLAATNKDLDQEVETGRFREDLYYRLNVVRIQLPPLRERREDIPELVDHLLHRHAQDMGKVITGVNHEAMQLLLACRWKGNVRELDNALQRAVILSDEPLITPADLPPDLAPALDDPDTVDNFAEAVRRFRKRHIERVLRQSQDKKEAAARLHMGLSSLYRWIEDLGIGTSSRRPPQALASDSSEPPS